MNAIDAIILGIVQGLTEFLPISSSGHLVIGEELLGLNTPGVSLAIWLHLGTLLAVIGYFYRRIITLLQSIFRATSENSVENQKLIMALIIGTVPAALVGIFFKSLIESAFSSLALTSAMLLVTAIVLLLTPLARDKGRSPGRKRGLIIGIAQAISIMPGISRSGSTIACAMFLGVKPDMAAEFSFLLAIPAITGAFMMDLITSGADLFNANTIMLYLLGAVVSFVFGLLSIHYLMQIIRKGRLFYFGFYCLVVGALGLVYLS